MLMSSADAPRALRQGRSLFGSGWKAVDSFEDLSDLEDYESEEEEIYVTMDLGSAVENRALLTETDYQLIGLDTPLPFMKLGNQIYQGDVTPLIGDEVILGLIRNQENPHQPSHPPIASTSHRISFRPVALDSSNSEQATMKDTVRAAATSMVGAKKPPKKGQAHFVTGRTPSGHASHEASVNEADEDMDEEYQPSSSRKPGYTASGKKIGRPKATALKNEVVVNNLAELNEVDWDSFPPRAKFILSPAILDEELETHGRRGERVYTKAEAQRIASGRPLGEKRPATRRRRKAKSRQQEDEEEEEENGAEADDGDDDPEAAERPGYLGPVNLAALEIGFRDLDRGPEDAAEQHDVEMSVEVDRMAPRAESTPEPPAEDP